MPDANLEPHQSNLLTLLRACGRAIEWAFCEDADFLLAATPPALPDGSHLRLRTLPADGDTGTGGRVWSSAPVLCRWMRAHISAVQGRSVLELGSGTGVCGLYAAALGASRVILTDGDESILPLLTHNAAHNRMLHSTTAVTISLLRWGCDDPVDENDLAVDLILGSDVIYDGHDHEALCQTLRALMAKRPSAHPTRVVFSSMPRSSTTIEVASQGCPDKQPSVRRGAERHDNKRQELVSEAALVHFRDVAASHGLAIAPLTGTCKAPLACDELVVAPNWNPQQMPHELCWTSEGFADAEPFLFQVVRGDDGLEALCSGGIT